MEAENKASDSGKDLLTPAEVATRMGVKVSVVLAWINGKHLHAINMASQVGPGRRPRWRVSEAGLAAFLAERSNVPPTAIEKPVRRLPPRRENGGEEFV